MEENRISEKESIELIASMIERTRQRYSLGDGNIFLLWGYLTVVVSALVWILLAVTHNPVYNWLWFLIWIIGGVATPRIARKHQHAKGMRSYSDKLVSRAWSTVGFSALAATFFCVGFLLFRGASTWSMMLSFALIIVPMAEIFNGMVVNEKSLIFGGGAGLLAGIFTTCCIAGGIPLGVNWFLPVFIVAFTCMMIIPGHILNHKAVKGA